MNGSNADDKPNGPSIKFSIKQFFLGNSGNRFFRPEFDRRFLVNEGVKSKLNLPNFEMQNPN